MLDIVFFSSPIGLGHAARDIAISQHLDISKRFVSGDVAPKLIAGYGFDADDLYKPPPFQIENGKLQDPLKWLFKYYSYYKECKTISSQILEKYSPQMVVSDEDFASLVIAQERGIKTILVTDILETRFVKGIGSLVEKRMNRSMKNIIQKCDLVIMPENGENENNIVRVGPIVRKTMHSRQQLREIFYFNKKTIVVSTSGTDSGKFLIEKTIESFERMNLEAELVVVSGSRHNLSTSKARNLGFVNNLHEVIFAADLVISLAGKSTIDESVYYGTPGIFIPIKGHFEQEENAGRAGYSYDDIFRLDRLIPEKIKERRNPQPYNGAEKAADLIRKFF
ncbi:MAG: UDP-N-acetylglucosamine--N-acetylmuramyl-(pentapeptide) pyrophosphoryl-undecaprenol N-acetylglucosamine transferase [Thaumarchaeota archaeon]|nr:MAG: UDP-N-acetylglucosamine--N-acetylmuramyl-(pentapeptide) pyrophosphoryl-undecaprenol N-acetylglucosamine transferase [Nitrososphaerota archaeon]TLX96443.1 MAG: UDP-N-acetylglucosamine--N-acetylmuramyl-(pentapeptide) pyrophosphoryl-undecaprenol N-acetylglucosamine transferase [Nitrososphaerota archaeon]